MRNGETKEQQSARIQRRLAADEVWSQAYDAALAEDRRVGRRYDKDRYAEAAHAARVAFEAVSP